VNKLRFPDVGGLIIKVVACVPGKVPEIAVVILLFEAMLLIDRLVLDELLKSLSI
tara:strand:- start:8 stop:172 length:165 start_codon:yes stop_codon:yes gene_type:complete